MQEKRIDLMGKIPMWQQWEWHKEWYRKKTGKDKITIESVPYRRLKLIECPHCHRNEVYENDYNHEFCIYCSNGFYKNFI